MEDGQARRRCQTTIKEWLNPLGGIWGEGGFDNGFTSGPKYLLERGMENYFGDTDRTDERTTQFHGYFSIHLEHCGGP